MNYEDLSLRDLQKAATDRDLPTYGKKADLVERLEAADYKGEPAPEPVAAPKVEPSDEYAPIAWREGHTFKVAYEYSGRLNDKVRAHFVEQTKLQAEYQGLETWDEAFWLFSQGSKTIFGIEVD